MQEQPTAMPDPTDATGVTITVRDNAFLRVAGPITLLDGEGNAIAVEAGKIVTLCRCGGSATKPFCDSSHRSNGFSSIVRANPPGTEGGEDAAAG
jgi:CDGSH-type Zn-finger protein